MSGTGVEYAPGIDVAIRQLLNQQAHIESRLSTLLYAQHGLDLPVELDMLRHKVQILENLVLHHGKLIDQLSPLERHLVHSLRAWSKLFTYFGKSGFVGVILPDFRLYSQSKPFLLLPASVLDRTRC